MAMIDYVCPACKAVTLIPPGFSRKKTRCSECGDPIATDELQRLTELWLEEQRQHKKRKQLLPTVLGLAVIMAILVGVFAGSLVWFGATFGLLVVLAALFYRVTVHWI